MDTEPGGEKLDFVMQNINKFIKKKVEDNLYIIKHKNDIEKIDQELKQIEFENINVTEPSHDEINKDNVDNDSDAKKSEMARKLILMNKK